MCCWAAIGSVAFPKPVYWFMSKATEGPLQRPHASTAPSITSDRRPTSSKWFDVSAASFTKPIRARKLLRLPRQGSRYRLFLDPRFIGAGWKAIPADLSTLRQGVRALKLLDDMNNWGLPKRLLAETDMFAIDHTSELYAHMNASYVRMGELPDFDNYGRMLEAVSRGDYFISMGEVLLPEVEISKAAPSANYGLNTSSVDLPSGFRRDRVG